MLDEGLAGESFSLLRQSPDATARILELLKGDATVQRSCKETTLEPRRCWKYRSTVYRC